MKKTIYQIFNDVFFIAVVFLVTFLFIEGVVLADDLKICLSPYALQSSHFNIKEWQKQTKGIGSFCDVWLYNSFGADFKNPKSELARPEENGTEVAFLNTSCVNNGNCSKYELLYGYTNASLHEAIIKKDPKLIKTLQTGAKSLGDFLNSAIRPDQFCNINTLLEFKGSRADYSMVTELIRPFMPSKCVYIWNPMAPAGTPQAPALISESHGPGPIFSKDIRCIANPDGSTIPDSDYPSYLYKYGKDCDAAVAWGPNMNCRGSDSPANQDPQSRSCKDTADFSKARAAILAARKIVIPPLWDITDDASLKGCTKVLSSSDGAKKGFLSKGSDQAHWYAWTILTPRINDAKGHPTNYVSFSSQSKGKDFATWNPKMSVLRTEDQTFRPIWRACQIPGKCSKVDNLPFNIVIRATKANKEIDCWKIANPRIRND